MGYTTGSIAGAPLPKWGYPADHGRITRGQPWGHHQGTFVNTGGGNPGGPPVGGASQATSAKYTGAYPQGSPGDPPPAVTYVWPAYYSDRAVDRVS
jgi:hypothetical protein